MTVSDIVILSGPPGAGKSTTAAALATSFPRSVHLHTDDFWHYIVSGAIPPYLPESDGQNHTVMRAIRNAALSYAAGGFAVIVDGVVGPWMLHHFRGTTQVEPAARVHYIVLRPSRDETLRRAQGRVAPGALVDAGPIASLWDQFSDVDEWEDHVIDTTPHTPLETLSAVRRAVDSDRFVVGGQRVGHSPAFPGDVEVATDRHPDVAGIDPVLDRLGSGAAAEFDQHVIGEDRVGRQRAELLDHQVGELCQAHADSLRAGRCAASPRRAVMFPFRG
ncbi:hypothetical protein GCM10009624_09750 [Gordonia sinesedis]